MYVPQWIENYYHYYSYGIEILMEIDIKYYDRFVLLSFYLILFCREVVQVT